MSEITTKAPIQNLEKPQIIYRNPEGASTGAKVGAMFGYQLGTVLLAFNWALIFRSMGLVGPIFEGNILTFLKHVFLPGKNNYLLPFIAWSHAAVFFSLYFSTTINIENKEEAQFKGLISMIAPTFTIIFGMMIMAVRSTTFWNVCDLTDCARKIMARN